MDAPEAIVSAVGGAGAAGSLVGWFARQAFKDIKEALAKLVESVEEIRKEHSGHGDRLARLETEAKQGEKHLANCYRLLEEHGKDLSDIKARLARADERSSGEKRRIR